MTGKTTLYLDVDDTIIECAGGRPEWFDRAAIAALQTSRKP